MWSLLIALFFILVALALWFARIPDRDNPGVADRAPLWVGFIPLVVALVILGFAFTTKVGTKEVGVVTTFGKISRCDLGPGLHLLWPWQKVTQLDGTIQTDKFVGDPGNGGTGISVRIADGSTATISSVIRWRIDPRDACSLYQDYRSNDVDANIADALVRTQFTASTASVFSDFDPLLDIGATNANAQQTATTTGIDLDKYSKDLAAALDEHLAAASPTNVPEIQVVSVTVSYLTLATSTQDRLNQYQAEVAKTRIAAQAIETAKNNAKAFKEISQSINNDPNVLVSKCLDIWEQIVQNGGTPPPATSCWPGTSTPAVASVPVGGGR